MLKGKICIIFKTSIIKQNKMKKVVFVIESLHLGGAEKSLVTLLQNLDTTIFEIDLIIFKEKGIFREFVPKYVDCIELSFPKLTLFERIQFFLKRKLISKKHKAQLLWPIIENKFKQLPQKYDIAIAYNQGFATYFVNKHILANIKYTWLNTDYKNAGYAILFDYPIYKNFKGMVAVSPEAKKSLEKALQTINKKLPITIIKDITDKAILEEQASCEQKIKFNSSAVNIVTVGRLAAYKGFALAIEACVKLVAKGYPIKWYVVGEGSERENLENLIKQNNLDNHFFLIGADSNPYPYIKNATIYVQTSLFEGLGLTVIEASLLNKPIVSTNFPSVFGIIKDGKTGLIAKMNAESIALQIERLILEENLRNKLVYNLSLKEHTAKEDSLKKVYNLFEK